MEDKKRIAQAVKNQVPLSLLKDIKFVRPLRGRGWHDGAFYKFTTTSGLANALMNNDFSEINSIADAIALTFSNRFQPIATATVYRALSYARSEEYKIRFFLQQFDHLTNEEVQKCLLTMYMG